MLPEIKPWQEKVLSERFYLEIRRKNLVGFTRSAEFSRLSRGEQNLLSRQLRYMEDYSNVLKARILGFENGFRLVSQQDGKTK